jgi:farnesyl diphosphate synthase
MTQATSIEAWLADSRVWIDRELERLLPAVRDPSQRLPDAMRYAVFGGGKRLRPALVRLVGAHFGASDAACALPAAAIECVHTYSLVHDDLPCMDDDDLRRGRATVHVVYGEALAVLAGDALLTHAFGLLARTGEQAADHARCLADAAGAGGMVAGQALDLEADEAEAPAARASIERVHALKTAALFGAACEMGAIAAGASAKERGSARAYGLALGHCFQAVDDILDVTGDAQTLGKTPGKDERAGKATLVKALGLEGARGEAKRLSALARARALELGERRPNLAIALVDELLLRRS